MSNKDETLEVKSEGASTTTVVSGDGGPWWVKYTMQAGFLAVLIMVLWGVYDLLKYKFPTVATPITEIGDILSDMQEDTAKATAAKIIEAAAATKQADAIERWVNMQQGYRVTDRSSQYGPPASTAEP